MQSGSAVCFEWFDKNVDDSVWKLTFFSIFTLHLLLISIAFNYEGLGLGLGMFWEIVFSNKLNQFVKNLHSVFL